MKKSTRSAKAIRKGSKLDRFLTRFARKVGRTKAQFVVLNGNGIRTLDGRLCPIEFVARTSAGTAGYSDTTKKAELTEKLSSQIMQAADTSDDYGQLDVEEQLIRARMLKAIEKHIVSE